jgi:Ni/Co efflux regulator RcnB
MKKLIVLALLASLTGAAIAQSATQTKPATMSAVNADKDKDKDKKHHHHHHHHHNHNKPGDKK